MYRNHANVPAAAAHANGATATNAARPSRYRSRAFGTGYGRSSGYAAARSYGPGSQPAPRFRLV